MKRRFIAGAVCPQCEQMDTVQMFDDEDNRRWRECVQCGFKDEMPADGLPKAAEPQTRVNQAKAGEAVLAHEVEVQKVTLFDPKHQ